MVISSEWTGIPGDPGTQHLVITITRNQSSFVADHPKVNVGEVEALLRAISEPEYRGPSARAFGFTAAMLDRRAADAFQTFVTSHSDWQGFYTQAQWQSYVQAYTDEGTVSHAIATYYQSTDVISDDYPSIAIRVELTDGDVVTVHSEKQATLMLPWVVSNARTNMATYNPQISYALAGLLPPTDVNNTRLARNTFEQELPVIVGESLSKTWARMPQFDESTLVKTIERQYNVALETDSSTSYQQYFAWNATLRWPDLPTNLRGEIMMPIVRNEIKNTEAIRVARRGAALATSIPWLRHFIESNKSASAEILIENAEPVSMGVAQIANFSSDMRLIGHASILSKLKESLPKSYALFITEPHDFSEWILLPTHNVVLWKRDIPDKLSGLALAGFPPNSFNVARCGQYLCSGATVTPNGSIANAP